MFSVLARRQMKRQQQQQEQQWRQQQQQQQQLETNPTKNSVQQDEEEPYSAEPYQAGVEYSSGMEKEHEIREKEEEQLSNVTISFEGEHSDTAVLVPGFFGFNTIEVPLPGGRPWTLADYWSDVRDIVDKPIVVNPSALGSLHDRAVEIFYQLKGGQVNYGESHSSKFGHKQYGRTYKQGLLPDWSAENPIVLIGKGYGGTTALHLQHLLATDFFGEKTSVKWIKGVITFSAPHRGSILPYVLGLQPGSKTIISPFSLLQLFMSFLHMICFWTWLDTLFGIDLNAKWSLSTQEGSQQTMWDSLCARSPFSLLGDNFLVDWSVEGARERYATNDSNRHQLDCNTIYINYALTGQTWKSRETGNHWPRLTWRNWPTWIISAILGQYKFSPEIEQQVLRTSSATYWQNDGILAVYSQLPQPHQQIKMKLALSEKLFDPIDHQLQPGAWYNVFVEDRSHTVLFDKEPFLMTLPYATVFLKLSFIQSITDFLSRNAESLEETYIKSIEYIERVMLHFRLVLILKQNNLSKNQQQRASNLKYAGIPSSKTYSASIPANPIVNRFEGYNSDKAGLEWIERILQNEVLNSPSKMIFWMKQYERTRPPTVSAQNGHTLNGDTGNYPMKKDEPSHIANHFAANATYGSHESMFINKTQRRMTAEEYRAVLINGNAFGGMKKSGGSPVPGF